LVVHALKGGGFGHEPNTKVIFFKSTDMTNCLQTTANDGDLVLIMDTCWYDDNSMFTIDRYGRLHTTQGWGLCVVADATGTDITLGPCNDYGAIFSYDADLSLVRHYENPTTVISFRGTDVILAEEIIKPTYTSSEPILRRLEDEPIGQSMVIIAVENVPKKVTSAPTKLPTKLPTYTRTPSEPPSDQPADRPSKLPSDQPSEWPSELHSHQPTQSELPSDQPAYQPSKLPSDQPADQPSELPSDQPADRPSKLPSDQPADQPSITTQAPSNVPISIVPTTESTTSPTYPSTSCLGDVEAYKICTHHVTICPLEDSAEIEACVLEFLINFPRTAPTAEEYEVKNVYSSRFKAGASKVRTIRKIKGILVEGAQLIVHIDSQGVIYALTGELLEPDIDSCTPVVTKEQAIEIAAERYGRECAIENGLGYSDYAVLQAERTLTFSPVKDKIINAWMINIQFKKELGRNNQDICWRIGSEKLYLDSCTGEIVANVPMTRIINPINATAEIPSRAKLVTSESLAPKTIMDHAKSNVNNVVRDCGFKTPNLIDISEQTPGCTGNFEKNIQAEKANMGGTTYVNHLSTTFGTDFSYFGSDIIQNVNYGTHLMGVYSIPKKQAFYGGTVYPDLVGHELTHGIIQSFGVFFPYQFESGALENAFCEIFGAVLKAKSGSTGADVWSMRGGQAYMNNPSTSYYDDFKEMAITDDYGGVHENSGIVSLVFVLLSDSFIGLEDATQIFYDALAGCLSSHSNFCATRFCTVDAATDEMKPYVEDAWDIVGLTAEHCNVPKLPCKTSYTSNSKKTSNISKSKKTSYLSKSKETSYRSKSKETSNMITSKEPSNMITSKEPTYMSKSEKTSNRSESKKTLKRNLEVLNGTSNKERSKMKGIRGRKKGTSEKITEKQGKIAKKEGKISESKDSSANCIQFPKGSKLKKQKKSASEVDIVLGFLALLKWGCSGRRTCSKDRPPPPIGETSEPAMFPSI